MQQYNRAIKFRPALFWDTLPKNIDLHKNASYIIERVAEFGNDKEARWVLNFYDQKLLKKVIAKSRSLQPSTRALWTLLLKK